MSPLEHPLIVENLPANRQVVLKGMTWDRCATSPVILRNNQGGILLDRLQSNLTGESLTIVNCLQVDMNGCEFLQAAHGRGDGAINVTRSNVTLSEVHARGSNAFEDGSHLAVGSAGMVARDSTVIISRATLNGGDGLVGGRFPTQPYPAIEAFDSQVTIVGDSATVMQAGQTGNSPRAAVVAHGGSVTLDPNVTLRPALAAPPVSGTASVTMSRLGSLRARGAPPGGVIRAELFSREGEIVIFLVGLSAYPTSFSRIRDFWLDTNLHWVTGIAVQGAGERLSHSIPVPNDPNLIFATWGMQAVTGSLTGGFRFSNPAVFALD
jgi:hypothetical protein